MYTRGNFKTKKDLKAAVARRDEILEVMQRGQYAAGLNDEQYAALRLEGQKLTRLLTIFQPNEMLGRDFGDFTGTEYIEGPHAPHEHEWYAKVKVVGGVVNLVY